MSDDLTGFTEPSRPFVFVRFASYLLCACPTSKMAAEAAFKDVPEIFEVGYQSTTL